MTERKIERRGREKEREIERGREGDKRERE